MSCRDVSRCFSGPSSEIAYSCDEGDGRELILLDDKCEYLRMGSNLGTQMQWSRGLNNFVSSLEENCPQIPGQ